MECHHHPRPTLISHGDSYHGAGYNRFTTSLLLNTSMSMFAPRWTQEIVTNQSRCSLSNSLMSEGAGIGGASVSWTPAPLT